MMLPDLNPFLAIAERLSREAGLRLKANAIRRINSQDAFDVKLQEDVDTERVIRAALTAETPFPVLGEEEGGATNFFASGSASTPYWVVDPIDGTYNYLRRFPGTCVSIGLMMGQEPLLGVIYDFNRDECFSALSTGPLCLNGVLQQPRWAQELPLACLMTGFRPPRDAQGEARMLEFWRKIQGFKKVRMIGTAALAVAYVAVGWADAYYEEGIYLWDVAAGLALVKAAGGHVHWTPTTRGPLCLNVWAFGAPGWTQNIIQSDGPICV